ncbi:efflux RND transporter periplasmic adaptor subunit [Pseudohoeflea coraliihabitans]|uniref:Efflux RND transporter periplasmic adaptor subunit n=1 Tax=Pseudohoeflea coraliihabitans TaxID=2860393 RepID=A0ABS6WIE9_9HYPH|nr:efflux RND transporter periplasmic adaptor subunit [Pseudohoeflea sp. DP4N28-3]MBW3095717.1 efflux RND transporter periplasmic adaptor subunit [Pseudohoeflea sp. DP4N28-3]
MPKFKFHRVAALVVLALSAAWVLTGEFSSVGSALSEQKPESSPDAATLHADDDKTAARLITAEPSDILPTVAVAAPDFIAHRRIVRVSGVTEPDKKTVLATRSAGVIETLNVTEGQLLKSGDVVLSLDGSEKQAAVETARALLRQRENEAANVDKLIARGISPKTQADDAQSALTAARAQLETAQAEFDRLQVVAPFGGIVDAVEVEEGSWATTGEAVATLLALDPIIARGEVSERERDLVSIGSEADVALVDGSLLTGTVRYVSREATAQTRTFPVEVAIANPDRRIPAGMTAEIRLKAEVVQAVKVPRSVVTLDAAGNLGVRVVDADDVTAFVPIDLIDDTPDGLVLGNVPAGARIVVAGQDLVSDGEKVRALPAEAAFPDSKPEGSAAIGLSLKSSETSEAGAAERGAVASQ